MPLVSGRVRINNSINYNYITPFTLWHYITLLVHEFLTTNVYYNIIVQFVMVFWCNGIQCAQFNWNKGIKKSKD